MGQSHCRSPIMMTQTLVSYVSNPKWHTSYSPANPLSLPRRVFTLSSKSLNLASTAPVQVYLTHTYLEEVKPTARASHPARISPTPLTPIISPSMPSPPSSSILINHHTKPMSGCFGLRCGGGKYCFFGPDIQQRGESTLHIFHK